MNGFPIITALTFLPLIGGVVILGFGEQQKCLPRKFALGFSLATLALALALCKAFDAGKADFNSSSGMIGFRRSQCSISSVWTGLGW